MNVKFYNNSSPTNKISKTLTAVGTERSCDIIGDVDVVNPVIVVKGTVASNANYMTIGAPLNRSYFITAMDYTTAGKVIISGHVDVLSTFSVTVNGATFNFLRGAGDINEMDDSSYPISDYMVEQYFPMDNWTDIFSNAGSGRQYLLRTIRGNAQTYPTAQLTDGAVVWCGTYTEDEGTIYYDCYQLHVAGTKNLTSAYNRRQDITGITQIFPGYYVEISNTLWQLIELPSTAKASLKFNYVGTTT